MLIPCSETLHVPRAQVFMDGVVLPPVAGRGDELRRLEQALARLRAGRGGLLGLIGDPGRPAAWICLAATSLVLNRGYPLY